MEIRLQKRIADSGFCSRRAAESLMLAGKVKVNGKTVTTLGSKVKDSDKIEVNGKPLHFESKKITLAFHKPAGVITSKSDPHHSETVMNLLPAEFKHLKPAGRLDKDSEGLLILSSDGELIQSLTHPKFKHKKTYEVLVKGRPNEVTLAPLSSGKLKLDGKPLQAMEFKIFRNTKDGKTWLEITLKEGRNRQIRRVLDALGYPVMYLKRIAIGNFKLNLEKGAYKILSDSEIAELSAII